MQYLLLGFVFKIFLSKLVAYVETNSGIVNIPLKIFLYSIWVFGS